MKLAELAKRLNSKNAEGLGLPPMMLITDARRLPDTVGAAARLPRGSAILLRDYDMAERAALAGRLADLARRKGLKLLIAGDPQLAIRVGAAGIHLPEARAGEARAWRYRRQWLITVAAHSRRALRQAAMCGADAALLSPVFATASHPGQQPLGLARFNMLAAQAVLPVYALGGINRDNAPRLLSGGAAGIAAIDAFAGQS
jgi:thiamine-phosphate pyrophosphorylase